MCREHLNFCTFLELLRKSKQSLRAAEKSQEKVEAYDTAFSAEFFGYQSVEMLFCQENKNSNVVNFLPEPVFSQALFFFKNSYDFNYLVNFELTRNPPLTPCH